mgnify:CR=1 FL=1
MGNINRMVDIVVLVILTGLCQILEIKKFPEKF